MPAAGLGVGVNARRPLVPPARLELPLLDTQALREIGLVAPDLLDEALGVLAAHVDSSTSPRGKVGDSASSTTAYTSIGQRWQLESALSRCPEETRDVCGHSSAWNRGSIARGLARMPERAGVSLEGRPVLRAAERGADPLLRGSTARTGRSSIDATREHKGVAVVCTGLDVVTVHADAR